MLMGKSVLLRPVKRGDLPDFLRWFNDPEVLQYLTFYLPMTEMAEQKWIEELGTGGAVGRALFAIEATEDAARRTIGVTELENINSKDHCAKFSIVIGEKDYWGKGRGTEAARLLVDYGFEQLNLHRVASGVVSFNERSIKMHRTAGFKEEGRQREAWFKNGSYHDYILFGILRHEWKGGN